MASTQSVASAVSQTVTAPTLPEVSVEPTTSSSPGPGESVPPRGDPGLESDLEGLHGRTRHQHPDRDCYPHRSPRACRDLGKPEHLPGLQQYLASVRCHRPRGSGLRTLAQGWGGPVSGCSRDSGDRDAADGPVGGRPRCRGTMPGRSRAGRAAVARVVVSEVVEGSAGRPQHTDLRALVTTPIELSEAVGSRVEVEGIDFIKSRRRRSSVAPRF